MKTLVIRCWCCRTLLHTMVGHRHTGWQEASTVGQCCGDKLGLQRSQCYTPPKERQAC